MILLGAEKKLGESVTRFFRMIDDKPIGVRLEVVEVRLEHRKTVSFHTRLAGDLCKKPSLCQFQAGLALHEGRCADLDPVSDTRMSSQSGPKTWISNQAMAQSSASLSTPGGNPEGGPVADGRRRTESVFASSPWQPKQMSSVNPNVKQHDAAGYLASAYHSLPSDASAQMTWPSFQGLQVPAHLDTFASGSLYPRPDHVTSSTHLHSIESSRRSQNIADSTDNSLDVSGKNAHAIRLPQFPSQGFTIQYGRFSAPTQREAHQAPVVALRGTSQSCHPDKVHILDGAPSISSPQQLQEHFHNQSDMLEVMLQNSKTMQERLSNQTQHLVSQGADLDTDFQDLMGLIPSQQPLQRAASALEPLALPQPNLMSYSPLEPYMPAWQSESVPAELPNHIVNRLQMTGQNFMPGLPRRHGGEPSSPTGRHAAMTGMLQNHQSLGLGDKVTRSAPESPDVDDLEELARTGDAEVAHRAFLVPSHKKRGKGGRQPASDPRLDPNMDERKAKRILANRLSAARSKMKQKNQMEGLGKMVNQIEKFKKTCQNDSAELMEECERMEKEKRRLEYQVQIIEEYYRRIGMGHAALLQGSHANTGPSHLNLMDASHDRMTLFD